MAVRAALVGGLVAPLLAGCAGPGNPPRPSPTGGVRPPSPTAAPTLSPRLSPTADRPCGLGGGAPPRLQHVVLIVMENRSYSEIVGSPAAPYFNRLAGLCGLATDYSAVAHPSLPNYLALTSGSTQQVTDDGGPYEHPISAQSIFGLLSGNWRSLEESMPQNCFLGSSGEYAVKHNPAAYYTAVRYQCQRQDVPLGTAPDLSAAYTFITPNLCHDMHDCSTQTGDHWLQAEIPRLLSTPQYLSGRTAIFVTWDESTGATQRVPALVIAPSVPAGTKVGIPYTHYSMLRTIEQLLGLSPLLGRAASATSMAAGFNL